MTIRTEQSSIGYTCLSLAATFASVPSNGTEKGVSELRYTGVQVSIAIIICSLIFCAVKHLEYSKFGCKRESHDFNIIQEEYNL